MNAIQIIIIIFVLVALMGGVFLVMGGPSKTLPDANVVRMEKGDVMNEKKNDAMMKNDATRGAGDAMKKDTGAPAASVPTAALDDFAKALDADITAQMSAVDALDTDVNNSASSVKSGTGGSIDTNF